MRSSRRSGLDVSKLGPSALQQLAALGVLPKSEKRGRYQVADRAERMVGDIVFDSKQEAAQYQWLRRFVGEAQIRRQVAFELQPAFVDVTGKKRAAVHYVADFVVKLPDGEHVLDAKGHQDAVFRLKEKLFLFRYRRPLVKIFSQAQLLAFLREHGVQAAA